MVAYLSATVGWDGLQPYNGHAVMDVWTDKQNHSSALGHQGDVIKELTRAGSEKRGKLGSRVPHQGPVSTDDAKVDS